MKLRAKTSLLILPLVVIPLLILGWISYLLLKNTAENRTIDQMQTLANQIHSHYTSKLNTAIANIQLFSNHNSVIQFALTKDPYERYTLIQKPLLRQFSRFNKSFPDYYEFRFILPDGYEDIRWTKQRIKNVREDESNNQKFIDMNNHKEDIYHSTYINPDNHLPALWVSKRIIMIDKRIDPATVQPKLRGFLVMTLTLEFLQTLVNKTRIGEKGYFVITDKISNILISPDAADIEASNKIFYKTLDVVEEKWGIILKNTESVHYHSLQKKNFIISSKFIDNNLFLIGILPEEELLSGSKRISFAVSIITITAILISASFILFILRQVLLKPINILNDATTTIARGHLEPRMNITSKDEIGELARSFEAMAYNLKRSSNQVKYLAYHDSLTGLPNRHMFNEYLESVIARTMRHGDALALLFLDLDDFKKINDSLGHQIGDKLLKNIATRLTDCLRDEDYLSIARTENITDKDIIARLGGDEFVVLLTDLHDPLDAPIAANRLLKSFELPVTIDGHDLYMSTSIGITICPDDGDTPEELIRNADIAMYHAKDSGKNTYRFYSKSLNEKAHLRLTMENKIRNALKNEKFTLYYQPQIDSITGNIIGLEALIRWMDPETGMVPPDIFIPIAEETGIIKMISEWVLKEACSQNKRWQDKGLPAIPVAVNISALDMTHSNIKQLISNTLKCTQLDPQYLEIELTESVLMNDLKKSVDVLSSVHELGVSIALDDFGTGYSSLSYLMRFPIQILKIERRFTLDITNNKTTAAIVSSVINMAHAMGLRVVAEGIKDKDQLDMLLKFGCDIIQGYYFSRPVDSSSIEKLLQQGNINYAYVNRISGEKLV